MSEDIHLNPASVKAYAGQAQENFQSIRTELDNLVSDAVGVKYYGQNAFDFKTKCGQMAADLANALTTDMGRISESVRTATSNISAALGGSPVTIEFNGATVSPPAVPGDDGTVGASVVQLESFKTTVKTHFTAISDFFSDHLRSLEQTEWTSTAKDNAVQGVRSFTTGAKNKVDETSSEMINAIDEQIQALNRANQ